MIGKQVLARIFCLILMLLTISVCGCNILGTSHDEFVFEPLEFPFANPRDIQRMAAFGIPNWSGTEPHNGIDLIVYERLASSRIVSPTNGTIDRIEMSENPYSHPVNQLILTISIYVNSAYTVDLVIEPGTADEWIKTAQRNAVQVEENQTVYKGQPIVDLLVGDLGYPHLHYMIRQNNQPVCAYPNSSGDARLIFDEIARTRSENNLPDGNICFGEGY